MRKLYKLLIAITISVLALTIIFVPILPVSATVYEGDTDLPPNIEAITSIVLYSQLNVSNVSFALDGFTFECNQIHTEITTGTNDGNATQLQQVT